MAAIAPLLAMILILAIVFVLRNGARTERSKHCSRPGGVDSLRPWTSVGLWSFDKCATMQRQSRLRPGQGSFWTAIERGIHAPIQELPRLRDRSSRKRETVALPRLDI